MPDADPEADAVFQRMSYTRQMEFVEWVTGAKLSETEGKRIKQPMAMLRARPERR